MCWFFYFRINVIFVSEKFIPSITGLIYTEELREQAQ